MAPDDASDATKTCIHYPSGYNPIGICPLCLHAKLSEIVTESSTPSSPRSPPHHPPPPVSPPHHWSCGYSKKKKSTRKGASFSSRTTLSPMLSKDCPTTPQKRWFPFFHHHECVSEVPTKAGSVARSKSMGCASDLFAKHHKVDEVNGGSGEKPAVGSALSSRSSRRAKVWRWSISGRALRSGRGGGVAAEKDSPLMVVKV